ncbi:hypothetical protein Tco_1188132, partial [Tanacetum coccineum]
TALTAKSLASLISSNGRFQFGLIIIGVHVKFSFNDSNDWWHSSSKLNGGGSLDITSILALSTSSPAPDTLCPSTIPSLTLK